MSLQGMANCSAPVPGSCTGSKAASAGFTAGWLRGSSRYHQKKINPHTTPSRPNQRKAVRQFTNVRIKATNAGVKAPPSRALVHMIPCARVRSSNGSQRLNALVRFGKAPASPAPNRKRVAINETQLKAHPVATVKNDHHSTMRRSTLRGPMRSPRYPAGISNRA